MRKEKLITFLMCIIMLLLTACSQSGISSNAEQQSDEAEIYMCGDTLPGYSFDTIEEIMEALTIWGRESYCEIREKSHYVELSGTYRQTLLAFESGNIKLAVPQLDGEDIPYTNNGDRISLLSYYLYKLPWIRYCCIVDDIQLTVDISYVSILNDENIDNAGSALEIVKILDSDALEPQNKKRYKYMYEQDIQLSDRKVKALVYEEKDRPRTYVEMYYDQLLIVLEVDDNELFTEEFFKNFSIRYAS